MHASHCNSKLARAAGPQHTTRPAAARSSTRTHAWRQQQDHVSLAAAAATAAAALLLQATPAAALPVHQLEQVQAAILK